MQQWSMYTQPGCSFCELAKITLTERGIPFFEIDISENAQALAKLRLSNLRTVPQIYDDEGNHIGGYDELRKKFR